VLCFSVQENIFGMRLFFWIFSGKISIHSSSMHVSCFVTLRNFFPLSLRCLLIYYSQSFLLYCSVQFFWHFFFYISPDTRLVIHFSKRHTVSLVLSISGTNLILTHTKTVTYCLNTYYRCTVGLGMEWILMSSYSRVWMGSPCSSYLIVARSVRTTSILFCMYLQYVTVCVAIYRLDW